MNKLQRLGRETETDRTCRVKMYKAGKNWLTSCQICRYFLNRAALKRVAISAGAVAMGMSLAAHSVKADTTDVPVSSNAPMLTGPLTQTETAAEITITNESSQASVSVAPASTATPAEKRVSSISESSVSLDSATTRSDSAADALTTGVRRNVKPEMAEVKGKRLIISAELEEGKRLNTSIVKQLCSTDEIYAEKKYMKPFSFTPSHTIVLYTNYLPHVGGNDEGIWRRLIVIPFNAKIAKRNDIKNYAQYLTEQAGSAVLQWIIEGAQRIIQQNYQLTTPAAVTKAVQAYHADNDWLGHFLNENCELDPSYEQKSGDLYQKYREYCQGIGEYIRSTTDFYTALKNAGFQRQHKQNGRFIKGLRLKVKADEFLS